MTKNSTFQSKTLGIHIVPSVKPFLLNTLLLFIHAAIKVLFLIHSSIFVAFQQPLSRSASRSISPTGSRYSDTSSNRSLGPTIQKVRVTQIQAASVMKASPEPYTAVIFLFFR